MESPPQPEPISTTRMPARSSAWQPHAGTSPAAHPPAAGRECRNRHSYRPSSRPATAGRRRRVVIMAGHILLGLRHGFACWNRRTERHALRSACCTGWLPRPLRFTENSSSRSNTPEPSSNTRRRHIGFGGGQFRIEEQVPLHLLVLQAHGHFRAVLPAAEHEPLPPAVMTVSAPFSRSAREGGRGASCQT